MESDLEEYATEPVPEDKTVGWFKVSMVAAMVAFSLPTFLTGVELAAVSSPSQSMQIVFWGALILTVIGSISAAIGASTRLSSYMLNRIAFGAKGAAVVNIAFAISLLGWFGVNIDLFSNAVQRLSGDLFDAQAPIWLVEILAGIVMTVTTVIGFRAINFLSILLVPVMIVVTVLLIDGALGVTSFNDLMAQPENTEFNFGFGVSSIVGAVIVGAIILPDICRFIRHWQGGVYLVLINYFVIQIIVTGTGAFSAAAMSDNDLLNIMIVLGIGGAAFAIVLAGSWVLNSLNLYSTMLSVESTFPHLNYRILVAVMGALGTVAAFFNILDYFLDFLFYLSVVFVPVAGVIAVDYLLLRRSAYHELTISEKPVRITAMFAWAIGAGISLLGAEGVITISAIAAVDAMLISALSYYLLTTISRKLR